MMNLPVMAFFSRAMRVQARGILTYILRAALVGIVLLYLLSVFQIRARLGAPGLELFKSIVWINWAFITVAAFGYFAGAITEEKAEMSLGLLKMTGLSPVSILLGKSTTRLLGALMILLAQLPLSLLAITLGGLAWNQFWAAYVALAAYMVFISNLALFCSVVSRNSTSAGLMTFGLITLLFAFPSLGAGLAGVGSVAPVMPYLTPVVGAVRASLVTHRMGAIMQTGFAGGLLDSQCVSNVLLGLLFFLLAWATFELSTREQKQAGPRRGLLPQNRRWLRFLGPGRAWRRAMAWKAFHFTAGGLPLAIVKVLAYGLILAATAWIRGMFGRPFEHDEWVFVSWVILIAGTLAEIVAHAGRLFNVEKNGRTLSGIIMLPTSTARTVSQSALGALIALAPNVLLLCLLFAVGREASLDMAGEMLIESESAATFWTAIVGATLFVLTVTALSIPLKRGALLVTTMAFMLGSCVFAPLYGILYAASVFPLQMLLAGVIICGAVLLYGRIIVVQLERAASAE